MQAFEEEKVYLDSDLNLAKFSKHLHLTKNEVSSIINQTFNCSFTQLLKKYRLEEAKRILMNADRSTVKLINVAFDSGFGNKVSFYRAFKESENMSPSDYLKQL